MGPDVSKVPDEMEDEPLQGVDVSSAQLIDDGVHAADHFLFVLQTWRMTLQMRILTSAWVDITNLLLVIITVIRE